jgi:hypothetical protein
LLARELATFDRRFTTRSRRKRSSEPLVEVD